MDLEFRWLIEFDKMKIATSPSKSTLLHQEMSELSRKQAVVMVAQEIVRNTPNQPPRTDCRR